MNRGFVISNTYQNNGGLETWRGKAALARRAVELGSESPSRCKTICLTNVLLLPWIPPREL